VGRRPAAPVVGVGRRTDIAAGPQCSWVAAELTARRPGTLTYEAASPDDLVEARKAWANGDGEAAPGRPVVLVTDGLAGPALRRAVRAERPDAIVVHTGPPAPNGAGIEPPVVWAFGAGRVNAEAAADLLTGGRP